MPEKNDFETNLISVVAHDLKTPISAVKGYVELIEYSGTLNERQKHFAERALNGLQRMEHLVTNLLDYARIEAGKPMDKKDFDLRTVIHESVDWYEPVAAKHQITIHMEMDARLRPVVGDSRLLSQVINNLLGNAIKYNRDGGKVWITASDEQALVRVDVRDTGIGIPSKEQPKVFERFFRARSNEQPKVDGSGLGLAIAQGVIQQHGGHIWVESEPGKGSTFSFTLPREGEFDHIHEAPFGSDRDSGRSMDNFSIPRHETPSEQMDAVDDNIQESPEDTDVDSTSDEV